MLDTARGSVLAWLLHTAAMLLLSMTLGWRFFLFSIPLCGAGSAALSYCFNRFLVFRRVRYACGPRMLFGAAVRTSLRLLFCCILHPLACRCLPHGSSALYSPFRWNMPTSA